MSDLRVACFLDGSNLYHKIKEIKVAHTSEFNYAGLCHKLARDRKIVYLGYYIGVVKAKPNDFKGQQLRARQLHVFNLLRKGGFTIKQGYLLKNNGVYHEKGVDVQLATDLLIGAFDDLYDVALVLSSDTDLIPAIMKVKELGKQVEYVGFSHQPSFALQRAVTRSYLLPKEELEEFVQKDQEKETAS